jgi:sugar (pentulose or hexulose) kinase
VTRRGRIDGLSFATTAADVAQAALEGVCYRFADVLDALGGVEEVVVTGGALLASPDWTQILADVLGRPLQVSGVREGSARGAALAAIGRLDAPAPVERVVEPRLDRHAIHERAREVQRQTMRSEEER